MRARYLTARSSRGTRSAEIQRRSSAIQIRIADVRQPSGFTAAGGHHQHDNDRDVEAKEQEDVDDRDHEEDQTYLLGTGVQQKRGR